MRDTLTCALHALGRPHFGAHRLAVLIGRYPEAMGVAVIVRDEELALSVVTIHDLRYGVTELQESRSERSQVGRRPVEPYAPS